MNIKMEMMNKNDIKQSIMTAFLDGPEDLLKRINDYNAEIFALEDSLDDANEEQRETILRLLTQLKFLRQTMQGFYEYRCSDVGKKNALERNALCTEFRFLRDEGGDENALVSHTNKINECNTRAVRATGLSKILNSIEV